MDAKTLNKRIDALGKKTEFWRNEVQIVLTECAARAFDDVHRDVDGFTRLIHKMQGADMDAVVKWIKTYAPARWMPKKDTPYGLGGFEINASFEGEYDASYLLAHAWWVTAKKPSDVPEFFDLDAAVANLIKRATAAAKAGKPVVGSGPLAETLAKVAQVSLSEAVAVEA